MTSSTTPATANCGFLSKENKNNTIQMDGVFFIATCEQTRSAAAEPRRLRHVTSMLHLIVRVLSHDNKKRNHPDGWFLFGDPERTRTVDLQRDRLAC